MGKLGQRYFICPKCEHKIFLAYIPLSSLYTQCFTCRAYFHTPDIQENNNET